MSKQDPNIRYDGFQVVNLGVDSGNAPNIIGRQRMAWGVNVTLRGGFPRTRPGWRKVKQTFSTPGNATLFALGLFQNAGAYSPRSGGHWIMAHIQGRTWKIDVDDPGFATVEVDGGLLNDPARFKAWSVQAEDWFIIQNNDDGTGQAALIFEGTACRRSTLKEVPSGYAMAYASGRLWVAIPGGFGFVASNLVGSVDPSGAGPISARGNRDAVLQFTHNDYLALGGAFSMPSNLGPITAIASYANIDTSLGQGPVQVFGQLGAASVNAPFDDTQWKTVTYPIQTVSMLSSGPQSQEGVAAVNGDLWFRSAEDVRSWQLARRDIGTWADTGMSFEMTRVLAQDPVSLLDHACNVRFDNRLLVLTAPQRVNNYGVTWQAVAVCDFSPLSSIGAEVGGGAQPIWEGIWTGLDIFQLVVADKRCFAFVLNSTGAALPLIELWEFTRDAEDLWFDDPGTGTLTPILCWVETPSYNFKGGWDLMRLEKGALWVDNLQGTVAFDVRWKPDQYPVWQPWHLWTENAKVGLCPPLTCPPGSPAQPQFKPYMLLPTPPDRYDATQNPTRNLRLGYEYQVRIQWTGAVALKKFQIACSDVEEDVVAVARGNAPVDLTGIPACGDAYAYSSF